MDIKQAWGDYYHDILKLDTKVEDFAKINELNPVNTPVPLDHLHVAKILEHVKTCQVCRSNLGLVLNNPIESLMSKLNMDYVMIIALIILLIYVIRKY